MKCSFCKKESKRKYCNRNCYINHIYKAKDKWENDQNKINLLQSLGFKVLTIWEDDLKNKQLLKDNFLNFYRNS